MKVIMEGRDLSFNKIFHPLPLYTPLDLPPTSILRDSMDGASMIVSYFLYLIVTLIQLLFQIMFLPLPWFNQNNQVQEL